MEPRTTTKPPLITLPGAIPPLVSVVQWAYRVDYGPEVRPRLHTVSKDRRCQCALGVECPAVAAVSDYLRAGGERAPDLPFDFWPRVPDLCPICGAATEAECVLTSREHGQGWRCAQTGLLCYWAARAVPLMLAQPARRYVIPPVGSEGETADPGGPGLPAILANVRAFVPAIHSQPRPAHHGITSADMAAARERAQTRRAAWAAEGYNPSD
jgi:hypothetical protein